LVLLFALPDTSAKTNGGGILASSAVHLNLVIIPPKNPLVFYAFKNLGIVGDELNPF
jgi:hypothetical protein